MQTRERRHDNGAAQDCPKQRHEDKMQELSTSIDRGLDRLTRATTAMREEGEKLVEAIINAA